MKCLYDVFMWIFISICFFFVAENRYSLEHRKYYFFDLRNRWFENMDARRSGNGEWRIVERNEEVAFSNNQLIGRKNTFVYWIGQGNRALMTQWWMHEFVIGRIFDPTRVMNTIYIDHYHYQKF